MTEFSPLPRGPFGVILADPPWRFEAWSAKGLGRSPQRHYDCLRTADICALPVHEIAARDCALVLWATFPMLPDAFQVLAAWGFRYVTGGAWTKLARTDPGDPPRPALGTGHVLRGGAEPYLIGFRGNPPVLTPGDGAVLAERGRHSAKPGDIAAMARRMFAGPHLELFARGPARHGWTHWGDQAEGAQGARF